MKKTFKFFAAALAIVAAASCAKEINVDTPADENVETVKVTFSASINTGDDTKSVLNSDKKVYWSDDDAIKVYYYQGNYLKLSSSLGIDPNSNDDDPTYATFSGDVPSATNYYAVATASGWAVAAAASEYIEFDGLREQTAVKNSYDPMKYLALSVSADENHFNFQNACSLLKVTIGSEGVYSVKVTGDIVKVGSGIYTEGSLGGKIWFKPGSVDPYRLLTNSSHNAITLKNSDSNSPLKKGDIYYIVIPSSIDVNNFTVSLLDQKGNTLGSKSKSKTFEIERNKVYDLGTLEYVPFLNVSTTNVSIPKKGGSVTINVDANVDWNVNNLAGSWLTVSKTSDNKGCVFTAQANKESSKRPSSSTSYVIINGGGINHIIYVSQDYVTYSISGSAITKASDLTNGQMYVVRLHSDRSRYWYANSSSLTTNMPSESAIPTQCVFVYKKDDSKATKNNYGKSYTTSWFQTYYSGNQYSYMSAGGWQSKYNDKYLTHDLKLSNYLDYYFTHMNGWINSDQKSLNTSEDFDIYKDSSSDMLNYNSSFFWGNGGTSQYKWTFYKVVEN